MPKNKELLYWNKKDGSQVLIKDMSDDYLLQTMTNLEAQAKNSKGKIEEKNLDPKYYVLKMNAIARDLIKK